MNYFCEPLVCLCELVLCTNCIYYIYVLVICVCTSHNVVVVFTS